jgi:hypothetical protein
VLKQQFIKFKIRKIKMNFSLLRNLVGKIGFNIGGRKNSCGDDIRTKGNVNIDKSMNINIDRIMNINISKENKIKLSKQAKRIYEEFKKSNNRYLGITRNEKGIPEISLQPSGEIIENLDLRFVEGNIQELVKYGYLVEVGKDVYELGK